VQEGAYETIPKYCRAWGEVCGLKDEPAWVAYVSTSVLITSVN